MRKQEVLLTSCSWKTLGYNLNLLIGAGAKICHIERASTFGRLFGNEFAGYVIIYEISFSKRHSKKYMQTIKHLRGRLEDTNA
jgi:hypothetical protein